MLDLVLLRVMKYRSKFQQIYNRVPKSALDPITLSILEDFGTYFEKMPSADVVDVPTLLPIFRAKRQHFTADQLAAYEAVLPKIQLDATEEQARGVMLQLLELRMAADVAAVVTRFEEGEIPNLHSELTEIETRFSVDADIKGADYIRTGIAELMDEEGNEAGLKFRLSCLQDAMRGMRGGDFGIIAGRPDRGKTTLLASEITYLAPQLEDPDANVLWLNNEGPGKRIIPRLYQAALGITMSEMRARLTAGTLVDEYTKAVGRIDRIRIVDIHGMDTYAVENIVRDNNTSVVVYDMIDNVRGFGDAARTDLGLERMYQWARELAVKYDMVGLATSQISNEGDGLQFPTLGMLKDSKTGKQGACDFQLMIGASNDPNLAGLRYISLPKNKLRREGKPGDPRATVEFKPQIARFEDVPIEGLEDGT